MQYDNKVVLGDFKLKPNKPIINISHNLLRSSQFLEKFLEILEWSTLYKQIRPLPSTQCCSILEEWQHRSLCEETVSDTCKQH